MVNLKVVVRMMAEKTHEHEMALEREYLALGEELIGVELPASSSGELKELFTRARGTRELIASNQETSGRLAKLVSQQTEVQGKIEEKRSELAVLAEEIEPQYEKVGRAAVEALAGEEEAIPYRKEIEQLTALESEIRQLNRDINRGDNREQEKSVVTQALEGGRRLYLQGLSRTKALRAGSLYRRLGKEVCESDLIGRLDSRAFVDVLEPVLKHKEQSDKIRAQVNALQNKVERLEGEIAALSEDERAQRKLQRLDRERIKAHEVLDVQLRELGSRYADRPVDKSTMPKKVKTHLNEVVQMRKALGELAARRERLEAAISIEDLERKTENERARVRTLESAVKKANKEIEGLATAIKSLNEEREKLLKVRGPLEELVLEPVEEE